MLVVFIFQGPTFRLYCNRQTFVKEENLRFEKNSILHFDEISCYLIDFGAGVGALQKPIDQKQQQNWFAPQVQFHCRHVGWGWYYY